MNHRTNGPFPISRCGRRYEGSVMDARRSRYAALLICSLLLGWSANICAGEATPQSLESLLLTIVPDDGPVRPPYEYPRYDLKLEPGRELAALKTAALERQDWMESRWQQLKVLTAQTESPQRTLLAYAFGEAKLDDARRAAEQLGDLWRFRLARLLLAECRFNAALTELISLADGNGAQALPALTQLVTLHEQARALAQQVPMVPFEVDLKAYLDNRALDPKTAQQMHAIRQAVRVPLAPVRKDGDQVAPASATAPVESPLVAEERLYVGSTSFRPAAGWNPSVFRVEQFLDRHFALRSLREICLDEFNTRLVLYRTDSQVNVITAQETSLRLHTDCGGEIDFKLYRFEQREEWEKLEPRTFARLKPVQSWSVEFRPLKKNNRDRVAEYPVPISNLTEGYYLATAEARYLPVIATQKFAVSHVALYIHASPNQAVVAAVDRRNGKPVPHQPIRLVAHGEPDIREIASGNRPLTFSRGFGLMPISTAIDFTQAPKEFEASLREYNEGQTLRKQYPDTHSEQIRTSDGTGTAVFPLDLRPGFSYSLNAVRQTAGFAETQVGLNLPLSLKDVAKTVVWPARTLYRPGDQVNFNGVIRRFNGVRIAPHDSSGKQSVTVVVTNGKEQLWQGSCKLTDAGCFSDTFSLSPNTPLGVYRFLVDGETAQPEKMLKVEHFRVPTFHVDLHLNTPVQQGGKLLKGHATVRYCFGKPVANAEVEIVVEGLPGKPPKMTVFTNAEGRAEFELPLQLVSQMCRGTVRGTAMDASGESYSDFASLTVTPVPFKLDVRAVEAPANRNRRFDSVRIQAHDWQDNPLSGVTVSMEGVSEAEVTDAQGEAVIRFVESMLSNRNTLQFAATHGRDAIHLSKTVTELTGPSIASEPDRAFTPTDLIKFSEVTCTQTGTDLQVKLRVERRGGEKSFVLLLVSNTRMLAYRALELEPGEHSFQFSTDLDFSPTCQLHAVLFTGQGTLMDTQVTRVKPVQRFLTLEVATEKQDYRPGETCRAVIFARDWRKRPVTGAEISLGVINEALYEFQRSSLSGCEVDSTPDLQDFFYSYNLPDWSWHQYDGQPPCFPAEVWLKGPKAAWGYWSSVEGPSSFGERMGGFGGGAFDVAGGRGRAYGLMRSVQFRARTRKDFRTEAHWVANLITDAEGRAKVSFAFPDDITEWRFTARGVTPDTMVGEVVCTRRTFLPAQIEWSLPRGLRMGDRITAAALVHNNSDQARTFAVRFGGSSNATAVSVPAQNTARIAYPLAPTQAGPVTLKAAVQALQTQEGDATERVLQVLPRGHPGMRGFQGRLKDGGTIPVVMEGAVRPENLRLTICIEPGVIGTITSALDELIQYPHGCVEQTMSRFLPAVIAGRAMKRAKITYGREKELPAILEQGVARLAGFQHEDGGWGWYEKDATNDFMTAYVLEGLTLCREAGHAVPARILEQAERYAFDRLKRDGLAAGREVGAVGAVSLPIYVAHALAFYYAADPSRFANQREQLKNLLPAAEKNLSLPRDHVLRADTYRLLGMPEKAKELIREATDLVKPSLRDRSMILAMATLLEAGEALEPGSAGNLDLARQLIALRRGSQWNDTQTTATVVRGLSALIGEKPARLAPVDVFVDNRNIMRLTPEVGTTARLVLSNELAGAKAVTLRPLGNSSADYFWSAWLSCHAAEPIPHGGDPVGTVTCRVFSVGPNEQEILPDGSGILRVKHGETLRLRLTFETRRPLSYVRVSLPRPCGVEIIRVPRLGGQDAPREFVSFEEHDDAFHFFFERCNGQTEFSFLVRPQVPGRVFAPPAEMEAMYSDPIEVKTIGPCVWQIAEPAAR